LRKSVDRPYGDLKKGRGRKSRNRAVLATKARISEEPAERRADASIQGERGRLVTTIDDFIALLRDEMGLTVTEQEVGLSLDEVAGWDSVQLLSLLTLLEWRTGRSVAIADVLEAQSLRDIYALAMQN
jgi:acyl carrier protein